MRWSSYRVAGVESFGLISAHGVVDAARRSDHATFKQLLQQGSMEALAGELEGEPDYQLEELEFLPVIPNPSKIFCVGLNYRAHQEETGRGGEGYPTIFTRFASSQVGHKQPLICPKESTKLDFEGEIALIIGKPGRRVRREQALQHIAGFSCYNDGSVRDYQRHTSQFTPGKNFDCTGGFGPWMMTPDEIGDLDEMEITTTLNGEVMQNARAAQMVFDFATLIEYCSQFATLEAGDVIVTGTPGGVGVARDPRVFMTAGDVIEVSVSPIGTLRNIVASG